jgi:hypothetical protein
MLSFRARSDPGLVRARVTTVDSSRPLEGHAGSTRPTARPQRGRWDPAISRDACSFMIGPRDVGMRRSLGGLPVWHGAASCDHAVASRACVMTKVGAHLTPRTWEYASVVVSGGISTVCTTSDVRVVCPQAGRGPQMVPNRTLRLHRIRRSAEPRSQPSALVAALRASSARTEGVWSPRALWQEL